MYIFNIFYINGSLIVYVKIFINLKDYYYVRGLTELSLMVICVRNVTGVHSFSE